jgi:hypothetical protein
MVFEPRLGRLRLRLAGFEPRLRLRLKAFRLKAQPIEPEEPEEPVHKISLEIPVIQYLPLFLKLLLLDTKIKFNYSFQHLLCIIYI